MLRRLTISLAILVMLPLVACDDDSDKGAALGAPCSAETVCQGVCNLALPEGMCVVACSDTLPCREGVCKAFTDTQSYCIPTCANNDECRENYTCVAGECRPLVPLGSACEETADCLPCEGQEQCPENATVACNEEICSFSCLDGSECPDGTYCADSNGEYWCVAIDFETGANTFGAPCNDNSCADGFTCLLKGEDDVLSYCTKECAVDRDCPPNMRCIDEGGTSICLHRENCDTCDMDSQCGYQTDRCVTADPAVSAGETYCSVKCDPERSGTCPLDYTCQEAFFCQDLNKWVKSCDWCPTGECVTPSSAEYQCFKDFGSCVGNGNLCEPCKDKGDCTETGAACLTLSGLNNYICTSPCDNSTANRCPDHYECIDGGSAGFQCIPRTGSCTVPSGGKETCRPCNKWSDCITGGCLPLTGDFNDPTYCLDFCLGPEDCGPYATCATLNLQGYNRSFDVCLPNTAVSTCSHWKNCNDSCPDTTQNCSYSYCVPNE